MRCFAKLPIFNSPLLITGWVLGLLTCAQWVHADLPDGPGKALAERYCVACHQTHRIRYSAGYSQADWQALMASMVAIESNRDRETLSAYLAKHFPPNDRRSPTLVDGDQQIAFQEWRVPTLGQRSRDPVQAPDGLIWWAGQWGNLIGSINPETGAMREYPLPASAMPHSVNVDAKGNIWYTGNKNGTLGMLNPKTGEITEHKMPDTSARDPHTAIFDGQGILWFTLQHSNQLGRLDPATGDIKLMAMPRPRARPYGIKLDAQGNPWVVCNGSNCLVKVDRKTLALTAYDLPNKDTRVRRLDFDSQGNIWFVNSSLGRLGRFTPASGAVQEWPSPSGADSHPYAIAVVDDIVWYNESGMRPDALVRFDPATASFQSWAIPSGSFYAGIVRHMRPTRSGDLLIHQSCTNRIIRVAIGAKTDR